MDGIYEQLRIALHQVWRSRWLALGVAWGLCVAGWLAVALIPNSYESKAKVYYQPQSLVPSAAPNPGDRQGDLLQIKQTMTSGAILEKVVRRTELNTQVASERDLAAEITRLREGIKITPALDNPNLFEISAAISVAGFSNAQNARTAHAIVASLLDLLIENGLGRDQAATGQTISLLDDELKRLEARLQEAEQRRSEFDQKYLGMLPGEGSLTTRMAAARAELNTIDQQLVVAQSALASLRSQMAATPAFIANLGGADSGLASGQIAALEGQLATAYSRGWTERHPDVVSIKAQIERLRPQAGAEPRGGRGTPNPAFASLQALAAERQAAVSAALTRKNQLEGSMAQLDATQAAEPEVIAEQARLNRDYDVLKRQYDKLLEDREQVRLRGDVQVKTDSLQFRIIDGASRPTIPAFPNRPLLLSGILFVALAAGIGIAFVRGQLQPTFPTAGRLEQVTGLPVLGTVSEVVPAGERALRRQRLKYFGGAGAALAASYAVLLLVEFWQRSTVA